MRIRCRASRKTSRTPRSGERAYAARCRRIRQNARFCNWLCWSEKTPCRAPAASSCPAAAAFGQAATASCTPAAAFRPPVAAFCQAVAAFRPIAAASWVAAAALRHAVAAFFDASAPFSLGSLIEAIQKAAAAPGKAVATRQKAGAGAVLGSRRRKAVVGHGRETLLRRRQSQPSAKTPPLDNSRPSRVALRPARWMKRTIHFI